MPTIIQTFQGRVTGLWGQAKMRGADGKMHVLELGDLVHKGDVILTSQDGIVRLSPEDSELTRIALEEAARPTRTAATTDTDIDRVISGLNETDSREAPAAGLNGSDGAGDLTPGLRVDRVAEGVTTSGSVAQTNGIERALFDLRAGAPTVSHEKLNPPVSIDADSTSIAATEQGAAVGLGLRAPTGTTAAAVITVTHVPLLGQLQKADGSVVAAGAVLSAAELTGLKYAPPADYDGKAPIGDFEYTVSERGVTATGIVTIALGTVNDAPVGTVDVASTPEDTPASGNVLANDRDVDGDTLRVTQYTVGGLIHAAGTGAAIAGVGTLLINAGGSYTFTPAADYNGPVPPITYTITDGTVTTTSTLTLSVTPVNDAPEARPDIASTPINVPITVPVLANDRDRDGDPITVTGATLSDPTRGTLTVNPDGTITFTPAANFIGPVTITYTVSDGHGGSGSATVTVNVGNNTPPTGADAQRMLAEDGSYTVRTADFGFADADAGQTLANVRIDTLPAAGTLLLDGVPVTAGTVVSAADIAAGKLVFVPAADRNGSPYASIAFSVQDSAGGYATTPSTLAFNVTPVNDAPVARADTVSGTEDTPVSGNVLANDSDVDGDALAVTQFSIGGTTYAAGSTATLAGIGTLVINANGSYSFTPAANYNGAVPVATYTATDGTLTSSATLAIALAPVNDAPVAHDDLASTAINTPLAISVLANDTDADGDVLTVISATLADPTHGTVTVNADGTLNFTPAPNVTGPVVIAYTVSDGHGGSDTATVTVNVGNNTPPSGTDATRTFAEDTNYVVKTADLGFTDADAGQTLANVRIDTLPAAGTLLLNGGAVHAGEVVSAADIAAGQLVFVPAANGNGAPYATFTFSVQDNAGAFDGTPNTLAFNVTPVNDVPVAVTDTVNAIEDQPFSGNVASNDTPSGDGGNVYALVAGSGPAHGTIAFNADGTFTYTPAADYHGADSFSYSLRDVDGDVSTATVAINVASVNDVPVAVADSVAAVEDTPFIGSVAINDSLSGDGGNVFALVAGSGPAHGGITFNADGTFTYTPNANYNGADGFTYSLRDADGDVSTATVTINVASVDDAPVAVADVADASEAGGVANGTAGVNPTGSVLANDTDADALDTKTVSAVSGTAAGSVGAATAGAYGSLLLNADGSYTYTVDNSGAAVQALRTATDTLTDTFTYTVRDAAGATSNTTLTITIHGANDAPVAGADTAAATEDATLVASAATGLLTNDSDVDSGDTKTISTVAIGATTGTVGSPLAGTYGTLTLNADGSYSYLADKPAAQSLAVGQTATETFSYTVRDAAGASSTATLTITITGTNDAPVAVADTNSALEDTPLATTAATGVLTNDSDADALTNLVVTQFSVAGVAGTFAAGSTASIAGVGTLLINADGSYSFTPAANYNGAVPVATYTVSDGSATTTAPLSLSVLAVNDVPVAVNDTASTAINTTKTNIAVLANDSDVDGDTLAVTSATLATPALGSVSINLDGTLNFTPAANVSGAVVINYSISDGHGGTASATLTVFVGPNTPPTGADATRAFAEDTSYTVQTGDFGFTDADAGQTLANVRIDTLPAAGTLLLNGVAVVVGQVISATDVAAGKLEYSPAANGNGAAYANFTFSVQDDAGAFDTAPNTLSFNVTPVNDAPVAVGDAASASEAGGVANGTPGVNPSGNVLANDTDVDAGDTKTVSAVSGAAAGTVGGTTAGAYGSLVLDAGGSYTYTVDNSAAAVQALRTAGDTLTDTFTYTVRDTAGAISSTTLTVTITGTNDAPVATADTAAATEDATLTATAATGVLANDGDVDAGDTKTVSAVSIGATAGSVGSALPGAYGTLTLNADGSYSYLANRPAAEALAAGQTATEQFSYTVRDTAGATSTATLTITITGTNDAPVAVADVNAAAEDTPLITTAATGVLANDSDVDAGTTLTVTQFTVAGVAGTTAAGSTAAIAGVGTLVINANGSYTFTPAANFNGPVPVATYTVSDGTATTTSTLTLNVSGVNDAPVAVADTATASEAGGVANGTPGVNPTGNVLTNDTDPDAGDTKTVSAVSGAAAGVVGGTTAGVYGSLVLNTDGTYTYVVDNNAAAVQALRTASNTLTDTFTYAVRDAAGATSSTTLTVTITGTNDVPVATVDTAAATEDATLTTTAATGVLANDTDVDAGDTKTVSAVSIGATAGTVGAALTGTYGTLTLNADGSYTYLANRPAAEALAAGQTATEQFGYTVRDTAGATSIAALTITITGTNDAPVAVADVNTVVEDTPLVTTAATGVLANDTDVDAGTTLVVTQFSVAGVAGTFAAGSTATIAGIGTLVINADGSYTFAPAANYGGTVPVATYTVSDGSATTTSTLTLSVTPVNDAPVAAADAATLAEDSSVVGNVLANDTDVDGGPLSVTQFSIAGVAGSFAAGTTATIANVGTLLINVDGSYSFVPQANYNGVAPVATYTVSDGAATANGTLTLTVTPVNDAPIATGSAALAPVAEDTATPAGATVASLFLANFSDPADAGNSSQDQFAGVAVRGQFVSAAQGRWQYSTDGGTTWQQFSAVSDTNALSLRTADLVRFLPAANFNGTPSGLSVRLIDNSTTVAGGATINVSTHGGITPYSDNIVTASTSVTPVNDAPVAAADTATASEAGGVANGTPGANPSGNVLTNDTDVDAGDTKTVSAVSGAGAGVVGGSTAGAYGTLVLNADGSYTYIVDNSAAAVQALRTAANTLTDTFTYTVRDAAGATSSTTLTVTITGANDAPVATVDTGSATEDVTLTATAATGVLANDTDVDAGDAKTVSAVAFGATTGTVGSALTGTYGMLTLNADGSYSYLANRPAAEALAAGQTATEQFTYTVRDTAGATSTATLTLTITGANDAPVAVADVNTATEDTPLATTAATGVLANDSDVDAASTLTITQFTVAGLAGTFVAGTTATIAGVGTLVINTDGSYTFTPAANFNGAVPVATYTVSDGSATTTSTLTLNVSGVNDAPVAVADTATASEAGGIANGTPGVNPSGNVLTNDTDPDAGDTKTVSAVSGSAAGVVGGATTGAYGSLVLNADGSYTYTVDNSAAAVQALRTAGNTLSDTFTYTVRDTAGAMSSTTLTVTITGTNDAPVASVDTAAATEDATLTTTAATGVLVNDSDVDAGDSKTVSAVAIGATTGTVGAALSGTFGTLTLNVDGSYTYLANRPAAEALAAGQTATETFSYTVRDAAGATSTATLTLTITGTNDAPVAVADVNTTAEDTPLVTTAATGVLANDSDVDAGSTLTVTQFTVAGVAGTFAAGSTATIAGVGTLVINANGSYTFTPTLNFNGAVPVATYTVSDGTATTTSTLTLNVSGVNDAPVAAADTATASEAGGVANGTAGVNPSGNVLTNDTDPDTGDTKTVSAVSGAAAGIVGGTTAGTYGSLALNADGTYTYTVNNNSAAVQALRTAANTLTDTFTYNLRDAAGATSSTTLTVTITGANDAPVAVADTRTATEDVTLVTTAATGVLANDTDVDSGDTKTVSAVAFGAAAGTVGAALVGTYGTLTLNADGSYSYLADRPAAEALAVGQSATEQFSYTMRDTAGTTSTATLTLTINGANDAPVATDDIVITNIAPGQAITIPYSVLTGNDTDIDTGTSLVVSNSFNAQNGTVSGTNPIVFRDTTSFGGTAQIQDEAAIFPTDSETTPQNNTIATAYEIARNRFGTVSAADAPYVGDATLPSFKWTGRIDDTSGTPAATDQDYLKVYLRAGEKIILDIDGADSGRTDIGTDQNAVDMYVQLFNSAGTKVAENDDASQSLGGLGSVGSGYHPASSLDSYLTYTATADGYYYINATAFNNNGAGINQDDGNYQLWISVQPIATPATNTFDYTVTDGIASDDGRVSVTTVQGSTLTGTAANEILLAGNGSDTLNGGGGNDILIGGQGADTMTGGTGADVFRWSLADQGTTTTPAADRITDFDNSAAGDKLDLRDLLIGEHSGAGANLTSYLHFALSGSDTVISISSSGGFTGGVYNPTAVDERITLTSVNLVGSFSNDAAIINDLLTRNKLVVDP